MGKIFQFPGKKSIPKKSKAPSKKENTPDGRDPSLTRFTWMGFSRPPALNAEFDVGILDKKLANFDDYDLPPPTCA